MNISSLVCPGVPLANASLASNFCAFQYPVTVNQARSVVSVGPGDALILERGAQAVTLLQDMDGDSVPDNKTELVTAPGLNHGLALWDSYIFASSATTVYRWSYDSYFNITSPDPTVVVTNISADDMGTPGQGVHTTRTLAFDSVGRLYISVGSMTNVDYNSFRARLRRFNISDEILYPIDFLTGEVFADGLRNEVGLAFDKHGVLWGVENGADNLNRPDLGVDIHQNNPAEELNRFPDENAGLPYGYPYCWTEYFLPANVTHGRGRGSVWAWPGSFDINYTDAQCQTDFVPPKLAMQAHSAPLGITFYNWKPDSERPVNCTGGFPQEMDGYAFIAFHGSWDRTIPTGYKVVYVPMNAEGNVTSLPGQNLTDVPIDLLAHVPPNAQWESGFRPVDVDFDPCGRLVVTSDGSGSTGSMVIRIESTATASASVPPSSVPTIATGQPSFARSLLPVTVSPTHLVSHAPSTAFPSNASPTTGSTSTIRPSFALSTEANASSNVASTAPSITTLSTAPPTVSTLMPTVVNTTRTSKVTSQAGTLSRSRRSHMLLLVVIVPWLMW